MIILLLKEMIKALKFKTLYVIGAGASYAYLPPRYDLYSESKRLTTEHIHGASLQPLKPLNESEEHRFRINIGDHTLHKDPNDQLLIDDTYTDLSALVVRQIPEILELCGLLSYSIKKFPTFCPEYQILNFTNKNSIIVNLNHDHLAETFIKERKIISLHGTVPPSMRVFFEENLSLILGDGFNSPLIKNLLPQNLYIATKELEHSLLKNNEYIQLQKELIANRFRFIIIIGYSFFKKSDCYLYDTVTYDLIRAYLYANKSNCKVIIIDPEPYYVADMFSKNISVSNISTYKIYWNCFTNAFFTTIKYKNSPNLYFTKDDLRLFYCLYDAYKELNENTKLQQKAIKRLIQAH